MPPNLKFQVTFSEKKLKQREAADVHVGLSLEAH